MIRIGKFWLTACCAVGLVALEAAESRAGGLQAVATTQAVTFTTAPAIVSPLVVTPFIATVQPQFVSVAQVAAVPVAVPQVVAQQVAVQQVVVPQVIVQQRIVRQRGRAFAAPRVVVQGVHCR